MQDKCLNPQYYLSLILIFPVLAILAIRVNRKFKFLLGIFHRLTKPKTHQNPGPLGYLQYNDQLMFPSQRSNTKLFRSETVAEAERFRMADVACQTTVSASSEPG